MHGSKRMTWATAAALMVVAAVSATPAQAAGATTCQIAATVTLETAENLLLVNGGKGSLSSNFVCEGTVAGTALNAPGTFSFCSHYVGGHTAQCGATAPPDQPTGEATADALGAPERPIVAHVVGDISIALNTGVACNMKLNGHTYGVQADLDILSMTCSGGFVADTAHAEANAQIIVNPLIDCTPGPGGMKACFDTLTFVGTLVAVDR